MTEVKILSYFQMALFVLLLTACNLTQMSGSESEEPSTDQPGTDQPGTDQSGTDQTDLLDGTYQISLLGDATMEVVIGGEFDDPGALAFDDEGNDVSDALTVTNSVQTDKFGVYTITYSLENSATELASSTRRVIVRAPDCDEQCAGDCIQLSANELMCASESASGQRVEAGVTIDASQVSCYAPCGVHFQAEVIGDFAVEDPFHHLAYHWHFDDTASYFRSLDDDFPFGWGANRAQGSQAGHVFEAPGNYNVELNVAARNGRYADTTIEIEVLDPLASYPAEQTVCVSTSGDFEGCPTGASTFTTWTDVVSHFASAGLETQGSYVLLKAGETFSSTARLLLRSGRHVFTRYGEGNDPVLSFDSDEKYAVFYTLDTSELSVSYISIEGDYDAATGLGDSYQSRGFYLGYAPNGDFSNNTTIYRVNMSGLGMCIYPLGGVGHVYADNVCTNWQDYGSLQTGTERTAFVGNSFKQNENAHSGPDDKAFSEIDHTGDGVTRTFVYDFDLAGDEDLGIEVVSSEGSKQLFINQQGYSLNLADQEITFDTAPAVDSDIKIFHRRWADHGPIRSADSLSLVIAQNDLFSNVGWFGEGVHHNPALRYNTNGTEGHSGVVVENRIVGGTMAAVFEPANTTITAYKGEVMVERNIFEGTEPTYYGVRSNYGNMTMRNNLIYQADILSTTNVYDRGIYFWEGYDETGGEDADNFSSLVEVYNNTVINLSSETVNADGDINYIDFKGVDNETYHTGSGATYTDYLDANNLVYAPDANDQSYHTDPQFNDDYQPTVQSTAENSDLPGLFDTLWGTMRQEETINGATE